MHRSPAVRVGEPGHTGRGQVSAWLESASRGPTWVAVQAAHMASATVEISVADAERLHMLLGQLITQAKAG